MMRDEVKRPLKRIENSPNSDDAYATLASIRGVRHHRSSRDRLHFLGVTLFRRNTSVATDEAICLGNMLDLPSQPIAAGTNVDERMRVLWTLVPNIPPNVIFSDQIPRLTTHGFRWAPASLLGSHSFGKFEDVPDGKILPEGLLVEFPGCILSCKKAPVRNVFYFYADMRWHKVTCTVNMAANLPDPQGIVFDLWDADWSVEAEDAGEAIAIILQGPMEEMYFASGEGSFNAVIVAIVRDSGDGVIYVRRLCSCSVYLPDADHTRDLEYEIEDKAGRFKVFDEERRKKIEAGRRDEVKMWDELPLPTLKNLFMNGRYVGNQSWCVD
jgi:hypothetical protein